MNRNYISSIDENIKGGDPLVVYSSKEIILLLSNLSIEFPVRID
jgi:hypothetical protein